MWALRLLQLFFPESLHAWGVRSHQDMPDFFASLHKQVRPKVGWLG